MTRPPAPTRRSLLRAALMAASLRGAAAAQEFEPRDRGIGGTGVVPAEPTGGDRGIGGTGVVGTIRGFGSILVNGLRITFPRDVRVRIDGRRARLGDLDVGHVVQVLARHDGARFSTRLIEAFSEVVGPVEADADGRLTVLGQTVIPPDGMAPALRRPGRWLAVSGLRRLDGTVAASLVRPRRLGPAGVAGVPRRDPDGTVRIGALPINGLPEAALGQPLRIEGRLRAGRLLARDVRPQWHGLLAEAPARLSVEDYVALDDGGLRLGSGFAATDGVAADAPERDAPAVLSGTPTRDGGIRVEAIQYGRGGHDAHPGGAPGRPPGPGPGRRPPDGFGHGPNDGRMGPGGLEGPGGPGGGPGGRGGPGGGRP